MALCSQRHEGNGRATSGRDFGVSSIFDFWIQKKNEEFIYKSKLPSWCCVPYAMRAMVGQQVGGTLVGDSLAAKTWLVWQMAIPNLCLYF